MELKKIYLDNGSTSFPKAPGVGKAMQKYIDNVGCNIGRGGYDSSYSVAEQVYETREKLGELFCFSKASNVIFTQSVTYSLNFLTEGLLKPGDHVITTSMEHNAVARPLEAARRKGVDVSTATCDDKGRLDIQVLESLIRPETKCVVMLHGSNVCGTLMPLYEVGNICRQHGLHFIVDAAQTAGIFHIDMKGMNIDGLAFTGHKGLLGPQGIGGFLINDRLAEEMDHIIYGGTGSMSDSVIMPEFLPDKFEPGTLNLPGILGLSAALDYINETGIDVIREKELSLTKMFLDEVKSKGGIRTVGPDDIEDRCAVVSLDFLNRDNAEISYKLDSEFGIMTRCGLHCAPLAHRTLGTFPKGTVRFVFGHKNTEEEVEYSLKALDDLIK